MPSTRLFVGLAITLLICIQPAFACRCWVGSDQTTDEERIAVAAKALTSTTYSVIGRIYAVESDKTSDVKDTDSLAFSHNQHTAAVIHVDISLIGDAPKEIHIPAGVGGSIYDGRIESNLLGTCSMYWSNGEKSIWLLLRDDAGNSVLASGCAHSIVRKWLYPQYGEE